MWVGRSAQRYKDVIHSSFFLSQEAARLKADTPETRRAFYTLVGDQWRFMLILEMKPVYNTGLYPPHVSTTCYAGEVVHSQQDEQTLPCLHRCYDGSDARGIFCP